MKTRRSHYKETTEKLQKKSPSKEPAPMKAPGSESDPDSGSDSEMEVDQSAPGFVIDVGGRGEEPQEEHEEESGSDEEPTVLSSANGATKRKKNKTTAKEDKYSEDKEKLLERFLFGNDLGGGGVGTIREQQQDTSEEDEEDKEEEEEHLWGQAKKKRRKAAWKDEEEQEVRVKDHTQGYTKALGQHGLKETSEAKYAKTLQSKFVSIVGTPKWAELGEKKIKEEEDSDDEFFRSTTSMLDTDTPSGTLTGGYLQYRKLRDLNHQTHAEGSVIKAVDFHPSAAVGLVAGINGTASLFQVDGKDNPKMQTVNFRNYPIRTAHFSADGGEFLVGSEQFPHFHTFDLGSGKTQKFNLGRKMGQNNTKKFKVSPLGDFLAFHGHSGEIHLLNGRTKERAFTLKMNEPVVDVAFTPDGRQMYSTGTSDEVYLWDLRAQDCLHRFRDSGTVRGAAVAVSPNLRYVATGSDSGVVNVYEREEVVMKRDPKPVKAFLNLVTQVEHLKFNPTSELLLFASENKENAVKLGHLPSMTVFANFPSWNFNVKRVNAVDFSPNGGFLAVGNNRGAANLYRLRHYKNF